MELSYLVNNNQYKTIKEVLKQEFEVSDRLLLRLKNAQKIFLNQKHVSVYSPVQLGDLIYALIDFEEDNSNIVPTKMNLDILYEDDCLLIINKQSNMAIHPSHQHYTNSLSNGVKYYFDSINLKKKIRPVNRLDKDTSGIVIFAKNEYIQECLIKQMKNKKFQKEYIAIIDGSLEEKTGTISAPIARKENSIIERCVSLSGATAITYYNVLKQYPNHSLVHFSLGTGRTHQIRVHCSYIGHPISGDTLYGTSSTYITRQALHSNKITFFHPITQKKICIEVPLPTDMLLFLKTIESNV